MVNIAVCDDNIAVLYYLENEIKKNMADLRKVYTLNKFSNPLHLKSMARMEEINLIFLDIEMPEINGFDLAKELRQNIRKPHIVFVSSHESRVFESFEYKPLWFMRKSQIEDELPRKCSYGSNIFSFIYYDACLFIY